MTVGYQFLGSFMTTGFSAFRIAAVILSALFQIRPKRHRQIRRPTRRSDQKPKTGRRIHLSVFARTRAILNRCRIPVMAASLGDAH